MDLRDWFEQWWHKKIESEHTEFHPNDMESWYDKFLSGDCWIPVEERLPDVDKSVLFVDKDGARYLGYHGEHGFWCHGHEDCFQIDDSITHWMPLPSPPKAV